MKQNNEKPNGKKEARALRKEIKRVKESRSSIKAKNRKKGTIIKKTRDRQKELEEGRDQWKVKCKQSEKESVELNEKYAYVAKILEIKEEQLRQILKEFEEFKKKPPEKRR